MGKNIKKFIKHVIKYNPFDYFVPPLRKFYRKLGILDFMDTIFYWLAWRITRFFLMKKLWSGKTTGLHNIPQKGAAVFGSNHSHALDPFFSACRVPRKVHWVSKIENYFYPLFRPILQCSGSIPLRRGESDKNAVRLIKNELRKGEIVGIFPEGTRTKDGYVGRFHSGAARFCLEFNCPFIPVGIIGAFHTKIGKKVDIHFGKPIYPNGMELNYENSKIFTERMRKAILKLCNAVPRPAEKVSAKVASKPELAPKIIKTRTISKIN